MPSQSFPNSSAIRSASYDEQAQRLTITFKTGGQYTYESIPPDIYEGLAQADSPGSYWRSSIKDQF